MQDVFTEQDVSRSCDTSVGHGDISLGRSLMRRGGNGKLGRHDEALQQINVGKQTKHLRMG